MDFDCWLVFVGGPLLYENVRLVLNSQALNGSQRVVLDDVINDDECSELEHLAHVSLCFSVFYV